MAFHVALDLIRTVGITTETLRSFEIPVPSCHKARPPRHDFVSQYLFNPKKTGQQSKNQHQILP